MPCACVHCCTALRACVCSPAVAGFLKLNFPALNFPGVNYTVECPDYGGVVWDRPAISTLVVVAAIFVIAVVCTLAFTLKTVIHDLEQEKVS